jgi:glycosyltransferase involved in cell wall biosynthesis
LEDQLKPSANPSVSVVIPTFNRASCLPEALETVFAQTYKNHEIIVVDDGSTDTTSSVVAKYGGRVRYIYQQNAGVAAARNAGVRMARGDWIAFLDSDDEWLPRKLEIQMRDLEENPRAVGHMVDCCISRGEVVQPSLFELRGMNNCYRRQRVRARPLLEVLSMTFFPSSCTLSRKALERAGLFDTEMRVFEDVDLLSRLSLQGSFLVNCYVGTRILRKPAQTGALSDLFQTSKLECYGNIAKTYSRLREEKLARKEKANVTDHLSSVYREMAILHDIAGDWRAYLSCVQSALGARLSPLSLAKGGSLLLLGAKRYNALRDGWRAGKSWLRTPEVRAFVCGA